MHSTKVIHAWHIRDYRHLYHGLSKDDPADSHQGRIYIYSPVSRMGGPAALADFERQIPLAQVMPMFAFRNLSLFAVQENVNAVLPDASNKKSNSKRPVAGSAIALGLAAIGLSLALRLWLRHEAIFLDKLRLRWLLARRRLTLAT